MAPATNIGHADAVVHAQYYLSCNLRFEIVAESDIDPLQSPILQRPVLLRPPARNGRAT